MKPSEFFNALCDQIPTPIAGVTAKDFDELPHKISRLLEAAGKVEIELRSWIDDSGEQVFRYNEVGDTDLILRAALAFRAAKEGKK